MTEDLLHFIWKLRLLKPVPLFTTAGFPLKIVHPGAHNTHAGPDFTNGRIVLGGTEWAGNIELHRRSSEWELHQHHHDKAYDNVILHVVYEHDREVFTSQKQLIPCLELKHYVEPHVPEQYLSLYKTRREIACGSGFAGCDGHVRSSWLERMLVERLERKCAFIKEVFGQSRQNWDETFYLLLCRNLGFRVNAEPFFQLARRTPLQLLLKHADKPLQLEALLFGQAGMLEEPYENDYPNKLKKEYAFLRHKYALSALPAHTWKMLRMRPANFPSLRIAQLAAFAARGRSAFSIITEAASAEEAKSLFRVSASPWWNKHYSLKVESPDSAKKIGEAAIENILVNTVCPLLFFYGRERNMERLCEKALDWYPSLKAESNHITRLYEQPGFKPLHAGQSQALIQLHDEYCSVKRCLHCGIGAQLIKAPVPAVN